MLRQLKRLVPAPQWFGIGISRVVEADWQSRRRMRGKREMSRQLVCVFGALALGQWLSSAGVASADVMEPSPVMPASAPFAGGAQQPALRAQGHRARSRRPRQSEDAHRGSLRSCRAYSWAWGWQAASPLPGRNAMSAGGPKEYGPSPVSTGLDRPRDSAGRLSRRSPAARKKQRKLPVREDC